jgi:hypothetical protein
MHATQNQFGITAELPDGVIRGAAVCHFPKAAELYAAAPLLSTANPA